MKIHEYQGKEILRNAGVPGHGVVDMLDAADFFSAGLFDAGAYNPAATGNVAAVPEPSLTLLGVAIVCLRRRQSATGGRTTGRSQGSRTR